MPLAPLRASTARRATTLMVVASLASSTRHTRRWPSRRWASCATRRAPHGYAVLARLDDDGADAAGAVELAARRRHLSSVGLGASRRVERRDRRVIATSPACARGVPMADRRAEGHGAHLEEGVVRRRLVQLEAERRLLLVRTQAAGRRRCSTGAARLAACRWCHHACCHRRRRQASPSSPSSRPSSPSPSPRPPRLQRQEFAATKRVSASRCRFVCHINWLVPRGSSTLRTVIH